MIGFGWTTYSSVSAAWQISARTSIANPVPAGALDRYRVGPARILRKEKLIACSSNNLLDPLRYRVRQARVSR